MPTVITRTPSSLRSLGSLNQAYQDVNDRGRSLVETLAAQIAIDPTTGSSTVTSEAALKAAIKAFGNGDAAATTSQLLAYIAPGFLSLQKPEGQFLVPFSALADARLPNVLSSSDWSSIGVRPGLQADTVAARLQRDFPTVPSELLVGRRTLNMQERAKQSKVFEKPRRDSDRGVDVGDPGGVGADAGAGAGAGTGTGTGTCGTNTGDPIEILNLIKAIADDLLAAKWSIDPFYVHIELDRPSADRLQAVLLGGSAASVLPAVFQQIVARAAPSAILASAGGWIGLAVLHFSLYWGSLIALNKGSKGVVLHHLLPWWVAFTGGVFSGYATAR